MSYREKIVELIREEIESDGSTFDTELDDTTMLFDSGLDSLGFAVLVARLEEEIGFDPFGELDEPVYPETFGEFVSIYDDRMLG